MPVSVKRWIRKKYDKLLKKYGDSEFDFQEAQRVLGEGNIERINIILRDLIRMNLMETKLDNDKGKQVYKLIKKE